MRKGTSSSVSVRQADGGRKQLEAGKESALLHLLPFKDDQGQLTGKHLGMFQSQFKHNLHQ